MEKLRLKLLHYFSISGFDCVPIYSDDEENRWNWDIPIDAERDVFLPPPKRRRKEFHESKTERNYSKNSEDLLSHVIISEFNNFINFFNHNKNEDFHWPWNGIDDIYYMLNFSTLVLKSLQASMSEVPFFVQSLQCINSASHQIIDHLTNREFLTSNNFQDLIFSIHSDFFSLSKILSGLLLEDATTLKSLSLNEFTKSLNFEEAKVKAFNGLIWILNRIVDSGVYGIREPDLEREFNEIWENGGWMNNDLVYRQSITSLGRGSSEFCTNPESDISNQHGKSVVSCSGDGKLIIPTLFLKLIWILESVRLVIRLPYMDCWRWIAGNHASSYSVKRKRIMGYGLKLRKEKQSDDPIRTREKETLIPFPCQSMLDSTHNSDRFNCPSTLPSWIWAIWGSPNELQLSRLIRSPTQSYLGQSQSDVKLTSIDAVQFIQSLNLRTSSVILLRCVLSSFLSILFSYSNHMTRITSVPSSITPSLPPLCIPIESNLSPTCA